MLCEGLFSKLLSFITLLQSVKQKLAHSNTNSCSPFLRIQEDCFHFFCFCRGFHKFFSAVWKMFLIYSLIVEWQNWFSVLRWNVSLLCLSNNRSKSSKQLNGNKCVFINLLGSLLFCNLATSQFNNLYNVKNIKKTKKLWKSTEIGRLRNGGNGSNFYLFLFWQIKIIFYLDGKSIKCFIGIYYGWGTTTNIF